MTQVDQKNSDIPNFASREAEFRETHEYTDEWNEFEVAGAKDVAVNKNLTTGITVRLTPTMLGRLREHAEAMGIGPSTLARMWILRHLQDNEPDTANAGS